MFFTPGVPSEFKVMVEHKSCRACASVFLYHSRRFVCVNYLWSFGKRSGTKPGHSTTAPGVTMGYRSSMPIIELKLTDRQASNRRWKNCGWTLNVLPTERDFRRHRRTARADQSRIENRQFSLTLSEQFTGGLLALNFLAQVLHCWRVKWFLHRKNPGANCALDYRTAGQPFCRAALAVSGFENEHLNFALATPDALSLCVCVSALRATAWLSVRSVRNDGTEYAAPLVKRPGHSSEHGWIEVVESMTLSV